MHNGRFKSQKELHDMFFRDRNIEDEIWKDFYEKFQISNCGRLRKKSDQKIVIPNDCYYYTITHNFSPIHISVAEIIKIFGGDVIPQYNEIYEPKDEDKKYYIDVDLHEIEEKVACKKPKRVKK